jgi:dolichyl-phosphate beta-glucosyltransferase
VDEVLGELFEERFISRWIFDVEILARAIKARRGSDRPPVRSVVFEQPLMTWYDIEGSKIRLRDFAIVGLDFVKIYNKYVRR